MPRGEPMKTRQIRMPDDLREASGAIATAIGKKDLSALVRKMLELLVIERASNAEAMAELTPTGREWVERTVRRLVVEAEAAGVRLPPAEGSWRSRLATNETEA